jgi:hypothetical protein
VIKHPGSATLVQQMEKFELQQANLELNGEIFLLEQQISKIGKFADGIV